MPLSDRSWWVEGVLDRPAVHSGVALPDFVDLVDFCALMVAFLPSPHHGEGPQCRVPLLSTGDSAQP